MISIDYGNYPKLSTSPLIDKAMESIYILDDIKNQMESSIPPFDPYNVITTKDLINDITQASVDSLNHATGGMLNALNCVITRLGYNQIDLFNLVQQLTNKLVSGNHLDDMLSKLKELNKLLGFWNEIDDILKTLISPLSGLKTDILDISNLLSNINKLFEESIGILGMVASIANCFPGTLNKDVQYAMDYMNNIKNYMDDTAGGIMNTVSDNIANNIKTNILGTSKIFIDQKYNLQNQINDAHNKIYEIINRI